MLRARVRAQSASQQADAQRSRSSG